MRLGYCCINLSLNNESNFKTLKLGASLKMNKIDFYAKIKSIILHNLENTYKILQWNVKNDIQMYRASSDLIPLFSHPFNDFQWHLDVDILEVCNKIKNYIFLNGLRVSFHPSQFNVLNSVNESTAINTIDELEKHAQLADLLGINTIILHVGGKTDGTEASISRFLNNFPRLSQSVKNKLVLENDDRSFNVEQTLSLCQKLKLPLCVDIHHDRCLESSQNIEFYINDIYQTWDKKTPKCHLSSGKAHLKDRAHADYINEKDFSYALEITQGRFDIMCEAKAKDLAILKIREVPSFFYRPNSILK